MCLMLIGTADPEERDRLEQAAREASALGLKVTVEHPPKSPWAREAAARATISERGGCACSLLSDDADWNAKFWAMRPEVLNRLAQTFQSLVEEGPRRLTV